MLLNLYIEVLFSLTFIYHENNEIKVTVKLTGSTAYASSYQQNLCHKECNISKTKTHQKSFHLVVISILVQINILYLLPKRVSLLHVLDHQICYLGKLLHTSSQLSNAICPILELQLLPYLLMVMPTILNSSSSSSTS